MLELNEKGIKVFRLFIPNMCRSKAMKMVYGLNHWGIGTMKKIARQKMFWPGMNKDLTYISQEM